jgi:alanyl-tRNA synthetase
LHFLLYDLEETIKYLMSMKIDELRERFLGFFKGKAHAIYPSASLVPQDDPTLLFTGAGMNQFKDMFLGKGHLPFRRVATCQKCLRTADIEKVGYTPAHHTFFEMLGNFSFGDYFKEDAIVWAWEFMTEELKIPQELLYVSVYEEDHEAYNIWYRRVGLPEGKIFRFGQDENFWPANAPTAGPNGPCGPCSEIFYDFGKEYGCGAPSCTVGCKCNRYVEVWNLVFTQFDRQEGGILAQLPQKNIDTGMGLERLGAVLQGVHSNFDTDIFKPLIEAISELLGKPYTHGSPSAPALRRIADHIRAGVFCISDGVLPSNEGRGYVERKILRVAIRDGISLGMHEPFLYRLVPVVIDLMKPGYPELAQHQYHITNIIKTEEERFLNTVDQGTQVLERFIHELRTSGRTILSGEEAFMLYDTYGFPLELTESILTVKGLSVDKRGFQEAMQSQRELARAQTRIAGDIFVRGPLAEIKGRLTPTEFVGYNQLKAEVTVEAIVKGDKSVNEVSGGDRVMIITDRTPFYGEAGGQVGDTGMFKKRGLQITVTDTKRSEGYFLHHANVIRGRVRVGDRVRAVVDAQRRTDIARNHSATHLLQNALRTILGTHIEQAGSLVTPDRLRFDFTHYSPLTEKEIEKVQWLINKRILEDAKVVAKVVPLSEAKRLGALMFFGEKYPEMVRMVSIGNFSKELCGGTHLKRIGSIGYLKIISEGSIGSGLRRIEALTGQAAIQRAFSDHRLIEGVCRLLETTPERLLDKASKLVQEVKGLKQEVAKARREFSPASIQTLLDSAKMVGNERVIVQSLQDTSPQDMRSMIDILVKRCQAGAVMLVSEKEGRRLMVVGIREDLINKGLHAGELARALGKLCGGGGGGKPHLAEAGGASQPDIIRLSEEFENLLRHRLQE